MILTFAALVIANTFPNIMTATDCTVMWNQGKGIIGQDVVLNCTANGRKCTGSFKWVGGPNDKVLTYKNKVLDSQKYAVNYIHAKEYALIIRNLSNIDLNVLYVCHCGFYHYGNILRLHEQHTYTIDNSRLMMTPQTDVSVYTSKRTKELIKNKKSSSNVLHIMAGIVPCLIISIIILAVYCQWKKQKIKGVTNKYRQTQRTSIRKLLKR